MSGRARKGQRAVRVVLALAVAASVPVSAGAAQYVAPPVMPIPAAWQGKAQAVVRVLNKLDAHVEVMTLEAGQAGSVGSLTVTPRNCLVRPDGLPRDAASALVVHDTKGTTADFSGWMFQAEPSLGVFESPVYGVQLVGCAGADVPPMAPPLPPPVPPPPSMQPGSPDNGNATPSAAPGGDEAQPGGNAQDVPEDAPPDNNGRPPAGATPPDGSSPAGSPPAGSPPAGQPDAVYPDGQPIGNDAAPGAQAPPRS
ncbi:MAG: DUF2155 domain-containing protein [Gluconacetobacter diazotrophicus]|nr:DUF2155 domain-containing protein [Gluconacetobacter diazotrophicus]